MDPETTHAWFRISFGEFIECSELIVLDFHGTKYRVGTAPDHFTATVPIAASYAEIPIGTLICNSQTSVIRKQQQRDNRAKY